MVSVLSNIRAEIKRGVFPAPVGTEAFHGYAIASSMGLIPEMESAARLTLGYPMTFESLGEGLQSFNGRALCGLVRYRNHCRDNLVSSLDSFFDVRSRCEIWSGCQQGSSLPGGRRQGCGGGCGCGCGGGYGCGCGPCGCGCSSMSNKPSTPQGVPPTWLRDFFTSKSVELKRNFTHAITSPSNMLEDYLSALKNHTQSCQTCVRVHLDGQSLYRELEDDLTQTLNEVNTPILFWIFLSVTDRTT